MWGSNNKIEDSSSTIESVSTASLDVTSRNVVMDITKQLYKNMDLQRISLPTFFLEPRSLLERITDSLSHPDLLIGASLQKDPLQRFLGVAQYFLSGWHSSPRGVKKPYNPVLGEVFRCKYEYDLDGKKSEAFLISEQVSHHPPISAFHYGSPENGIYIEGEVRPKTRFLGTCVTNTMEGENRIVFTHFDNEEYVIKMPSVYIYGVLYGSMYLDLGDKCSITCKATGYVAEFKFSTKGFFSGGEYNWVSGTIKEALSEEALYTIAGQWSNKIYIMKGSSRELFFDATSAIVHPKLVAPIEKQYPRESRRLWANVSEAIIKKDLNLATEEKVKIENRQRADAKRRKMDEKEFSAKFFTLQDNQYKLMGIERSDYANIENAKSKLITTIHPTSHYTL